MKLKIYYTNDIHSEYQRLAGIAAYLKTHRENDDLLFDGGDFCDRKNILIEGSRGLSAISLLRYIGYDAMVVGNNEIDLEADGLAMLAQQGFPLLAANLRDTDDNRLAGIKDALLIQKAGIRFLVIGTSPYFSIELKANKYNVFFEMGHLRTSEPLQEIRRTLAAYHNQYDVSILLSHSGQLVDQYLIEQLPEIDICLGGHSHTLIHPCQKYGQTYYLQTGSYAQHLGVLELTFEKQKLISVQGGLQENNDAPDSGFLALWDTLRNEAEQEMSKPLYQISRLDWSAYHESPLTNFICDALRAEYPCELSLIHAGIVDSSLSGKVSRMSLLELSPSKLNPTRFPLSGWQLRQAVIASLDEKHIQQDGKGAGFRGKVLGTLGFSYNVRIDIKTMTIWVDGELLQDTRIYDCVSDDYLQRGSGYPSLKTPDAQAIFYNGFIRDLLMRQLPNPKLWETCYIQRNNGSE